MGSGTMGLAVIALVRSGWEALKPSWMEEGPRFCCRHPEPPQAPPMYGPAAGRQDGLLVADCDLCGFESGNFSVDVCGFYYNRVGSIREFGRVQRVLEASVSGCIRKRSGDIGAGDSKSGRGYEVAIDEHGDAGHLRQTPRPACHTCVPREPVAGCRRLERTPGRQRAGCRLLAVKCINGGAALIHRAGKNVRVELKHRTWAPASRA